MSGGYEISNISVVDRKLMHIDGNADYGRLIETTMPVTTENQVGGLDKTSWGGAVERRLPAEFLRSRD